MEDPEDTTMVYGDDFGLNEAGVATVLFQSPIANAGQHPSSPGRKWNHSFSKRSPTGKRTRVLPDSQCEHGGCFQFTKVEDGRCLVNALPEHLPVFFAPPLPLSIPCMSLALVHHLPVCPPPPPPPPPPARWGYLG